MDRPILSRRVQALAVVSLAVGLLAACATSAPDRQAEAAPDTAGVQAVVCMANSTGHLLPHSAADAGGGDLKVAGF